MAKNAPAPAPPALEPEIVDSVEATSTVVSSLPSGVMMHDAGALPYTTDRALRLVPDPKKPPTGWKGTYRSCGGCGDFLTDERCPKCSQEMPPNVSNTGLARATAPKVMA